METTPLQIQTGDTVRIACGMHTDRIGKVTYVGSTALYVEFTAPALVTEQDGPTEVRTLPFSRRELVRVEPEAVTA